MAMKKREKMLAIATGVLLVPFVAWTLMGSLGGSVKQLRANRANLIDQIHQKQAIVERGKRAEKKLREWDRRSLPSDPQVASSLYQNWLLKLCEDESYGVGFEHTEVNPASTRPLGQTGQKLTFSVRGEGSLEQLTRWLHGFYSAGHLHRIRSLNITPMEGSNRLGLDISVEALALAGASDAHDAPRPHALSAEASQLAADLDEYRERIVGRAIFSPYQPPPPEPSPGDSPPKPPLFDHGKYTFVTAIVEVDGRPQVWIVARTTGKKYRLFEGESFEVGSVKAKILRINHRSVESEVDGRRYEIALGDSLRDYRELPN